MAALRTMPLGCYVRAVILACLLGICESLAASTVVVIARGASYERVRELIAADTLASDGAFAMLARRQSLHPLAPGPAATTAVAYATLVTGVPPVRHKIVGNEYAVAGRSVSGFEQALAAPTIVETAIQSGRSVVEVNTPRSAGPSLRLPPARQLVPPQIVHVQPQSEGFGEQRSWCSITTGPGAGTWVKFFSSSGSVSRIYIGGTHEYDPLLSRHFIDAGQIPPGDVDYASLRAGTIDARTYEEQLERFAEHLTDVTLFVLRTKKPDLLLLDLPVIDRAGHHGIRDDLAYKLVDAALRKIATADTGADVIVVSPHGMTPVHTAISLSHVLRDIDVVAHAGGPVAHLYGKPEGIALAMGRLRGFAGKDGRSPFERVVLRREANVLKMPAGSPTGDIVVVARAGYVLLAAASDLFSPSFFRGDHGYGDTPAGLFGSFGRIDVPKKALSIEDVAGIITTRLSASDLRQSRSSYAGQQSSRRRNSTISPQW